ncbi:EAL domain-containing protein [Solibacillus sp. CAU 1738]|uniref:bifunctional diguanylate cyclase/phosphodiesterase n=1 Tax=Solibacillus sp. CAU 1738 TaxID=3140363 RepID=UPI0032608968
MHLHITAIPEGYKIISGEYALPLVILSVFFVCLSSYTAITMSLRANNDSFINRYIWTILASIAMGFGIWSLHYVGMLAFALPIKIEYNLVLTILSIIPAMLAAFFAFYSVNKQGTSLKRAVYSSLLMGIGVCSMHFIGMASMQVEAKHTYNVVGLVIAVVASFISFFVFSIFYTYMNRQFVRVIIGIVMGICISITHYVAMLSMKFYVQNDVVIKEHVITVVDRYNLALELTILLLILVSFLLSAIFADKYVEYRAKNYDPHTHLPNFNIFEKRLANREYKQIAVWHFNEWTNINQQFGYIFGEAFIKKIAAKFLTFKSHNVDVYRISQDQLAIATKQGGKMFEVEMRELAKKFEYPLQVRSEQLPISVACALSQAKNNIDPAKLYDNAMSIFRQSPSYKQQVIIYDETVHSSAFEEELEQDIVTALKQNELYLVYQPKINSLKNEVVGFETLLRWQHSKYGFVSPAVFIPILEKTDKIQLVTDWVIERVCQQIINWQKQHLQFHHIAINIPGNYVTSQNLVGVLDETILRYGVLPQQLELEITETSFVNNVQEAIRAVELFREKGYSVALDDFGTGVSSLSYLKQMNISTLKIDKSFIDDIPHSVKDASILRGIIAIGESLELNIVIEGVEIAEQVQFIEEHSIKPIIQGYYFAKPLEAEQVYSWYDQFNQKTSLTV